MSSFILLPLSLAMTSTTTVEDLSDSLLLRPVTSDQWSTTFINILYNNDVHRPLHTFAGPAVPVRSDTNSAVECTNSVGLGEWGSSRYIAVTL